MHLKLLRIDSLLTALRAIVGWPLLLIGLFMASAWIGSSLPANAGWKQPSEGIDIFVETNGVHVSLIVPLVAGGENLTDLIHPDQLSDPALYGTHAMIGWGHAGVYRHARTWADVRSGDVASAIIGSDDVLLHVYQITDPHAGAYTKRVRVSAAQYHRIIAQIRHSFRLGADGRSIAFPAYAPDNLFYAARGHYNAVHTCNEWTGTVLRRAGVRVGRWTPFAGGVMRWF